jgi:hypothetical protein
VVKEGIPADFCDKGAEMGRDFVMVSKELKKSGGFIELNN